MTHRSLSSVLLPLLLALPVSAALAQDAPAAADLHLRVGTDRSEVASGGEFQVSLMVTNAGAQALTGLDLAVGFPADKLRVTDAKGGAVEEGRIVWTDGTLASKQVKTLVFRARLNKAVQPGELVQLSASIRSAAGIVAESSVDITAVPPGLPRSGPSDFFGPVEDARRFLSPLHQGDGARAAFFWALIGLTGLTIGVTQGEKVLRAVRREF